MQHLLYYVFFHLKCMMATGNYAQLQIYAKHLYSDKAYLIHVHDIVYACCYRTAHVLHQEILLLP